MTKQGTVGISPSDLSVFVECAHATSLDLRELAAGRKPPRSEGAFARLLAEKGDEHEQDVLARYRGLGIEPFVISSDAGVTERVAETAAAMGRGEQVIYQAAFAINGWLGFADFIERVTYRDGAPGYEPVDAKLTRSEGQPTHALQLAWYAEAIAALQGGRRPGHVHLELGSGRRESIVLAEIDAYARRQRSRLEAFVASPAETAAYPCAFCDLCGHRQTCESAWRADDHLSYVAGIRRTAVQALQAADVGTLKALASLPSGQGVPGIPREALLTLREQAHLQAVTRASADGAIEWVHTQPLAGRGFDRLPEGSPGDIVLDLEGDPVWQPSSDLVFLFGYLDRAADGWTYHAIWAHTPEEERAALETLVGVIQAARAADPEMHVYHYSQAEQSMLSRIAERYRSCEDDLYALERGHVFVDLYAVIRQGLRAGVESYGLKAIEGLAGFERTADVHGGDAAVVLYERWRKTDDVSHLAAVAAYNAEDCFATVAVADWLRTHRPDCPPAADPAESKVPSTRVADKADARERRRVMAEALRASSAPGSVEATVSELLGYHFREERASGREFHELAEMPSEERAGDSRMLHGLVERTELRQPDTNAANKKSWVFHTLTFPDQEHKVEKGQATDPDSGRNIQVFSVDDRAREIVIRREDDDAIAIPASLFCHKTVSTEGKEDAIERVASTFLADGADDHAVARSLLLRTAPAVAGLPAGATIDVPQPGDPDSASASTWTAEALKRATELTSGVLTVQGPPGTGKTWVAGRMVVALLAAGRKVGVSANTHKAIDRLLEEVTAAAGEAGVTISGSRYATSEATQLPGIVNVGKPDGWRAGLDAGALQLVAGTSWQLARADLDAQLDVVLIDEAGQYALADAVAAATSAKLGLILVGDPLQLAQVTKASHHDGAGSSAIEHALGGEPLIDPDRGILLTVTRRMHPDVCSFVSDTIYEGRLSPLPECAIQDTDRGTGIRFIEVDHAGRGSRSPEEAAVIREQAGQLLTETWTDRTGTVQAIGDEDVLVVTPYNAQRRAITSELALLADPAPDVRVGTVDRFQGQEAPVVLISMATSSGDDIPRSVDFLLSRNRLNVAVSRAQCLAVVVASPRLLDVRANTIDQMRLISTLCALREAADRSDRLR